MIRILLADDSVAIRGLLRRMISAHDDMEVVAACSNGQATIESYKKHKPDVVLLDVDMPQMDGLESLRHILALDGDAQVIMCSGLTQSGADVTVKALRIGAVDYIPKPSSHSIFISPEQFQIDLIRKIRALRRKIPAPAKAVPPPIQDAPHDIKLRPTPNGFIRADIMGIASSTGGVHALFEVLEPLKNNLHIPVLITQHMPPGFTKTLADHITQRTGIPAHEAQDGMAIEGGHIYVAPGDYHLEIARDNRALSARLSSASPENFCRPSADPMFRSILQNYRNNILALILTGIGNDGMEGARAIVENGHNVLLAQDEASSAVWGMPGAVARAGLCHEILPLSDIGPRIAQRYL